jgi:hypothetical protein
MENQQTFSFETTSSAEKNPVEQMFEQPINETVDNVLSSLGTVC